MSEIELEKEEEQEEGQEEEAVTKSVKGNGKGTKRLSQEELPAAAARKEARVAAKVKKLATIATGRQQAEALFKLQEHKATNEDLEKTIKQQQVETAELTKNLHDSKKRVSMLEQELVDTEDQLLDCTRNLEQSKKALPSVSTDHLPRKTLKKHKYVHIKMLSYCM